MPPKNRFITCEICGERAKRKDSEKRMFMAKFPLDKERCKQWVKVVGKEDLVYVPIEKLHTLKYVCGKHFEKKAFNKKQNRLRKSAIPSKNLKAPPLPEELLRDFPCHIYANIITTDNDPRELPVNEDALSYIESIPGPEPSTLKQSPLHDHDYCTKNENVLHLHTMKKRSNSEPSTSKQSPVHDDDSCIKKRKVLHLYTMKRSSNSEPSTSQQSPFHDHDYCTKKDNVLHLHTMKKRSNSDNDVTPRKRKLLKKIRLFKRRINVLQEGNIMPRIKSLALKTLIKAYIRNHGKNPKGNRWTSLEKALAIALYKKSPRTYRHLQHLLSLPSIRTLQNILQSIELEPGISPTIMDHLKKKASNMNEKDKYCALLFDEIALKKRLIFNCRTDKVEGFVDLAENQYRSPEIANHALVFMLQGLHKKLKQPIAYYFVKGTISSQKLAVLIKDISKAITDIGYTIITTVCDQGPTNIGSLNLLKEWCGIPTTSNYFLVDNMKIFIMFDIPHLFKSIRNNFHSGGVIIIDGKKGKWSHLQDVAEKNKSTLHFKKLTTLHVNPTFRSKMKVKLAAQVLSNTVAAILKLMAEKYGNDAKGQEILETAQIVENLDRLFDCTNGPTSAKDTIKKRRENVSKKTNHMELWKYYKEIISKMYFTKSDSFLKLKNVRCIKGYLTSLSSLEDIWRLVESKGFKYLNLRQLNQDSLENLFGMIRQHCPTNRNPTCHHFTAALKSNILTKLSTPVGRGANCEKDDNQAIIDFEDFFAATNEKNPVEKNAQQSAQLPISLNKHIEASALHLPEDDNSIFHIPEENDNADITQIMEHNMLDSFEKQPTVYVAGYLAAVVLKKIRWQCENCVTSLKTEIEEQCDKPMYAYIKLREWWQDKKSLTYPSENLCRLVDQATECFENEVKPILHEKNISAQAISIMLTKCGHFLWICNDHRDKLLHILFLQLSHLLIRNQCNIINLMFAKSEESTADIIKKAQQQGTAK